MDPLTILLACAPILVIVALFLCWDQPFFQDRRFRIGLGIAFLLITGICGYGLLASFELGNAEGLAWRLRYLTLGAFAIATSFYFFLKKPILPGGAD